MEISSSHGDPDLWLPILKQWESLNPRLILPGHRKIVTAEEGFTWARSYLEYAYFIAAEAEAFVAIHKSDGPIGFLFLWAQIT
jgi:hypothetical protein